jgi:cytochrome-b5 reductase
LLENAGDDATTAYEDIGHSTDAREILENYLIGKVTDEDWTDYDTKKIPEVKPHGMHVVNNLPLPKSHDLHVLIIGAGLVSVVGTIVLGRRFSSVLHRLQGGAFWKGFALSSAASMAVAAYVNLWATKNFQVAHKDFQSYPAHFKAKSASSKPPRKKDINLGVLNARSYEEFKLIDKFDLSHDTIRFVFALPSENSVLGLPTGQHIAIRHEVDGKQIARSYTPTSSNKDRGRLELTIKIYKGGKLTPWLISLNGSDTAEIRGPKGEMKYHKNSVKEFGMIAGGTGITPMFQIIRRICEDPRDDTKTTLLYANKTEEDILLKKELDAFAEKYDQFKVQYILSSPPDNWQGGKGRINKEMIEQHLPAPAGMDSKVLVCGPDPMMESMVSILQERGFKPPGRSSSLLCKYRS